MLACGLALALLAMPDFVSAQQCDFCHADGEGDEGAYTCTTGITRVKCDAAPFGLYCSSCDGFAFNESPALVAPDGSAIAAFGANIATAGDEGPVTGQGLVNAPSDGLIRSSCNGVVIARHYGPDGTRALKEESAEIVI